MNVDVGGLLPGLGGPTEARRSSGLLIGAAVIVLLAVAAAVAVAAATGRTIEVAAVSVAAVGVLVSIRWPLLPLVALALFIPFEDAINIEGIGTLGRFAEVLFLVVYGVPRLGRLNFLAVPAVGWGFVIWAALSAGWALDSATAWTQITPLILQFATAVLIANAVFERPAIVQPLLWIYSLAAAATAVLALATAGGGLGAADSRAAGLANQDPAQFAAILVPALIFGFYELVEARWLVPSALIVLLSSIGIVISGTRSAWLAVVVVFALFVIPRLGRRQRFIALAVVGAVIAVVIQIPGVTELITERTDTALSTGGAGRTDIWTIGLAIFATSPWIGVGLANFPVANTAERARDALLPINAGEGLESFEPHNIYLGTLGELGIIGFILFITFVVPLVVRRSAGRLGPVVQAAMASLLVIGLFLDVVTKKEFWFFVGLTCGLIWLAQRQSGDVELDAAGIRPMWPGDDVGDLGVAPDPAP